MLNHGREKFGLWKNGRCPLFFFFGAPILIFFTWAPRPSCAHRFFFLLAPITSKKSHGHLAYQFLFIFLLNRKLLLPWALFEKIFRYKKLNFSGAPIVRPLFFFYFSAHYLRKKIMGGRPLHAHAFFFFAHDSTYLN